MSILVYLNARQREALEAIRDAGPSGREASATNTLMVALRDKGLVVLTYTKDRRIRDRRPIWGLTVDGKRVAASLSRMAA